jgi:hypothetical protein
VTVTTVCECGHIARWKLDEVKGAKWRHWDCKLRAVNDWPREVIDKLIHRERMRKN